MEYDKFDQLIDALAATGACGRAIGLLEKHPEVRNIYMEMLSSHPELAHCIEGLLMAHATLVECFEGGNKLLICGNGGSFADALHISGELLKSFEVDRSLSSEECESYAGLPLGAEIAPSLEHGLPVVVLGNNGALGSAMLNDSDNKRIALAQECHALGRRGDVLLALSTSGEAENVIMAMSVARVLEMPTIALVGKGGGRMGDFADYSIIAPGNKTKIVQEKHVIIYHALCAGIEAHFYC